jgi:pimeloyl-ACP methyl ester carboxylesterase
MTMHAATPFGEIAHTEHGEGEAALFVHGVFLNNHLWRHAAGLLADRRRCIAIDLMGHGATRTAPGQDLSFAAQAEMIGALLDTLKVDRVDLVANDSGGAIAQIFAAHHPERLRSLTLTNCDVHDRWPPPAFLPLLGRARSLPWLESWIARQLEDPRFARSRAGIGVGFQHPGRLSEESIRRYLGPLVASPQAIVDLHRFLASMDCAQTVAVEPRLRALAVPTLILWGIADTFFDIESARWLRDTIPGTRELIELPQAKLFFPDDLPELLIEPLRHHWNLASAMKR